MPPSDHATVIGSDFLPVGVVVPDNRGQYSNASGLANFFDIVRSGHPKTLRGIQSGLKHSHLLEGMPYPYPGP